MTTLLLANWKLIVIGVLSALVVMFYNLWLGARDDLASFKGQIAQSAADAEAENARMLRVQLANLNVLKVDYEAKLPQVRSDAIANYLARRVRTKPAGETGVPSTGTGIKVDDGTSKESIPDPSFIADCAEDAHRLTAWQQYGRMNHLPIKE
jgi:hypothetical protein